MSPDIIVYGVVAAGLIFWLRSILGTRHGDERERPNPLEAAPSEPQMRQSDILSGANAQSLSQQDRITALAAKASGAVAIDNKTAEGGLIEISRADKSFDIDKFMEGAQDAFVMIVEAFSKGERDTLSEFLGPDVFKAFDFAIAAREKSGETIATEIHAIRKAEVLAAMLQGKTAMVTIRFTAEETRVVKNAAGEITAGNPDKITKMVDIWTFSRIVSSKDPRWLLVETRSDDENDNDIIPNTDTPPTKE